MMVTVIMMIMIHDGGRDHDRDTTMAKWWLAAISATAELHFQQKE